MWILYEIIIVVYIFFVWEIGRYLDLYYLLSELDVLIILFLNVIIEENIMNKIVKGWMNVFCFIVGLCFYGYVNLLLIILLI